MRRTIQLQGRWSKTGSLVRMVPSKHSAVPSKPTEDPHDHLSRDAHHSSISKFQDRSDQDYVVFRQRIMDSMQIDIDTVPLLERYSIIAYADLTLAHNFLSLHSYSRGTNVLLAAKTLSLR